MKHVVRIAIALLLPSCLAIAQTDLDAPAVKPVTVRSEIDRGHSAAIAASIASHSPVDLEKAVSALIEQNVQNRTETDGFRLGLAFGAWQNMWLMLSLGAAYERAGGKKLDQSSLAAGFGDLYYKDFKTHCSKVGVMPDQMKELFGQFRYNPQRDDLAWEAAVKSKKFRSTKVEVGPPKP